MSTIKRSKTDAFSVKESVNIVKLAEAAFEQISIDQLTDVVVETPTDGDILVYNSDLMAWENVPQTNLNYDLEDLDNITITSVSDGQVLTWDSGTSKWVNETPTTGATTPGGSDTHVQYNDGGVLGADAGLNYDKATGTLSATQMRAASVAGPDSVTGTQLRAGTGGTLSTLSVDPSASAPYFSTGGDVYDVLHTGNTKTVNGQYIAGSGDISVSGGMYPRFIRYKDSWAHLLTQGSIRAGVQAIFNTTANRVYYWPICRTHDITIENLCIFYDSTVNGQVGIYSNDTTGGYDHPGTLLASASATGSDIKDVVLSTPVNVSAGDLVWFAYTNAGAYRIRGTPASGYSSLQPSIDRVTSPSFPEASMYSFENTGSFGLPASAASSLVKALNTSGPILPSVFFQI